MAARTSQFAHFGFNRDTSVFVGASRSKASPYLLLLLRMTRREFTICEHRASDPSVVTPASSHQIAKPFFSKATAMASLPSMPCVLKGWSKRPSRTPSNAHGRTDAFVSAVRNTERAPYN